VADVRGFVKCFIGNWVPCATKNMTKHVTNIQSTSDSRPSPARQNSTTDERYQYIASFYDILVTCNSHDSGSLNLKLFLGLVLKPSSLILACRNEWRP
jgi:hypothetical protein